VLRDPLYFVDDISNLPAGWVICQFRTADEKTEIDAGE
jgi:hypothetical protein